MASAAALIELGDRYWALGLPAAARSALGRALAMSAEPDAALRLTDIALAQGDAQGARAFAAEAVKRAPGPATRILLGRAQLAAGEVAAARMSLVGALDAPRLGVWDRARAHRELSCAALAQGDPAGAAAQAGAAFEAALAAARAEPDERDAFAILEEICAQLVVTGRAADATATLDAAPDAHLARAALLAARQAAGDATATDRAIDDALAAAAAARPDDAPGRLAVDLRRLERRARKPGERAAVLAALGALIDAAPAAALPPADRARLYFLHGSLCADDAQTRAVAEDAYRKGLALQPGHTGAACRLALLVLDRGDHAAALAEIERALRIDASHDLAWRNAARMLDAQSPSLGAVVGRLLDAADPGAGSVARGATPRLVTATAEVARHDVLAGVYAHGHRVKNLLGILGARVRSAKKLAAAGEVHDRLRDLETDVTALYEEWAVYLRSMQAPTPTVELVPLAPLLVDVAGAAQARTQHVPIVIDAPPGLPDLRGDRVLLREALLNVVSNAAEACAAAGGEVVARARAIVGGAASPIVELVIADTGPGIPRAHLGRLFVPGFTTKETGSGVGLAIAERVIAAHHGRITVESEEGRGTTITITLPTDRTQLVAQPLWTGAERAGGSP